MNQNTDPILYINSTQTQYYLIPADLPLPEGDLMIRNTTGEERLVDKTSVSAFEISAEDAQQHIQDKMSQGLEQTKNAFVDFLRLAAQEAQKRKETQAVQPPRPPSKLLTSLLGFTPDELRQDPNVVKEKLGHVFANIKTVLEGAASDDPAQQEAARAQMRSLRVKLEEHDIQTNQTMEQIPDKLRDEYFSKKQEELLRRNAAELEKFAAQINQAATSAEQGLRQQAVQLKQQADDIDSAIAASDGKE